MKLNDPYHPSKYYYMETVGYIFSNCFPEEKKLFPPNLFKKRSGIRRKPAGRGLRLVSRRAIFRKYIMQQRMRIWRERGWQALV